MTGVTRDYSCLQGVRRGYTRLEEVAGVYKLLQGISRGYIGLQGLLGVTRDYRG